MNRKNILAYSVKWFVLIVLLSAVMWQFVFDGITRPSATETIDVFVTADVCDTDFLHDKIAFALDIPKVGIYSYSPDDVYYAVNLTTTGLLYSDLLIISSENFRNETTALNFAPLSETLLTSYGIGVDNLHFIASGGTVCAITVFDREKGIDLFDGALKYADETQSYCIAVSVNRPNAAPYSQQKHTTDNAFRALAALIV